MTRISHRRNGKTTVWRPVVAWFSLWSLLDNKAGVSAWSIEPPKSWAPIPDYHSPKHPVRPALARRQVLAQGAAMAIATALMPPSIATAVDASTALNIIDGSNEDNQSTTDNDGIMSATEVADLLNAIPTFTIVDKRGVPYMVVGEDAKVTGYFFTSFREADRILQLARTSADKAIRQAKAEGQQDVGENPWIKARISTVPLPFAVTLCSKSLQSRVRNYFHVAPAEDDIDDALAITGKTTLAEGKVPLFYMQDFTDNNGKSPLYFRKSELVQDYRKQHPSPDELPDVLVSELFAVLLELVKPGGTDEELKNIVLVPPRESAQKAQQCRKAGGKESPFLLGQRNVIL